MWQLIGRGLGEISREVRRVLRRSLLAMVVRRGLSRDVQCLKRDGITGEHRLLWSIVKSKLRAGLEIVKLAGDGILNLQKGETQAWGLTEDDVKTDQQEVIGITQEMAELTVSPGAEEALDGDQAL